MVEEKPRTTVRESTRFLLCSLQIPNLSHLFSAKKRNELQSAYFLINQTTVNYNQQKHPLNLAFSEKIMALIPSFFGNSQRSIFDPFWDPFKDFPFPSSLSSPIPQETSSIVNIRVDWKETPEDHVFKADLPGLKKEEVKVEIEDDRVLQISGQRNIEKEDKNDTWHREECSSGKFSRRFRLPENVKMDQIKASMENGVLTVTVPKVEVKKPDVKTIEISG